MNTILFPKIDLVGKKAALIDIDSTLYPYEYSHKIALKSCFENFKKLKLRISYKKFQDLYRGKRLLVTKRLEGQGACRSRLLAFQMLFEELKIENNFILSLEYEEIYWNSFINSIQVESEALKFLVLCKKKYISVCAVTDMQASIQIRKLKKLGVAQYIDYLVTSEEVGYEKPDPRIFQYALNKLAQEAQDCVMIGDHYEKDILGAESLGIVSYQVK